MSTSSDSDSQRRSLMKVLSNEASTHIYAERYADAEIAQRRLIELAGTGEHEQLYHLHGLLASILHSLERHEEAGLELEHAYAHAKQSRSQTVERTYRYFLAHYYVNFGDPERALHVLGRIPSGQGPLQCRLHITSARALAALGRHVEAKASAEAAFAAASSEEDREEVRDSLAELSES